MRVTIIGSGALACLFGAHLSSESRVCILGSWNEGLDAIKRDGIRMDSEGTSLTARVHSTMDESTASLADLVLVLVKSWQTKQASQQASRLLASDGMAITLQNGLGNYDVLQERVGAERSAPGVTEQAATLINPGHVYHCGFGPTNLGFTAATHKRVSDIRELFERAGLITRLTDELDKLVWSKLTANAGINALTAILRVPNGELLSRPDAAALMIAAAKETAAVAEAKGIRLPFEPDQYVQSIARETAANHSSMYQDIERGAPTEVEAINGAVVREATALGVEAPVNHMLAQMVRAARSHNTTVS